MTYDTAWDMPKPNWSQQGSFDIPEIPPVYEPDAEPLVCLPPINVYWLPFVMGALDQLRNPSSWLVADDTAMYNTLARVTKLRQMIGDRVECMSYQERFDAGSCQLQYSLDGGTTWLEVAGWSDFLSCLPPQTKVQFTSGCDLEESFDNESTWSSVPGWSANFADCVVSNAPIIGLPPNPGDDTHDQFACSIAAYLADQVILLAMQKAVNAVQDDLTLLVFGAEVLTIIPEFILVAAAYDAFASIYGFVAEGTLAHYEAAIADESLWQAVTCAIYSAIRADGYVTPGNFGAILTNVDAISYTYSDVISAIHSYISTLGATGLAQLSQRAGLLVGSDCSACPGATWCFDMDFTVAPGDWTTFGFSPGDAGLGTWVAGRGWQAQNYASGKEALHLRLPMTAQPDGLQIDVYYGVYNTGGGAFREIDTYNTGTFEHAYPLNMTGIFPTINHQTYTMTGPLDRIDVYLDTNGFTSDFGFIQRITIHGDGPNPLGDNNCT